jgi:hypothetical protein
MYSLPDEVSVIPILVYWLLKLYILRIKVDPVHDHVFALSQSTSDRRFALLSALVWSIVLTRSNPACLYHCFGECGLA